LTQRAQPREEGFAFDLKIMDGSSLDEKQKPSAANGTFAQSLDLKKVLDDMAKKSRNLSRRVEFFASLLSTGISLGGYRKSVALSPPVTFNRDGIPEITEFGGWEVPDRESARWIHDFVVDAITRWEGQGLSPEVPEWGINAAKSIIEQYGGQVLKSDKTFVPPFLEPKD
jgi:hypothetical protein